MMNPQKYCNLVKTIKRQLDETPIYQNTDIFIFPLPYELRLLKLKYVHSNVININ